MKARGGEVFHRRRKDEGLTALELLIAAALVLVLAGMAMPLLRWEEKRRKEVQLRMSLEIIRGAIDQYERYVNEGQIVQKDVDQMRYPKDLDELVEGVEVSERDAPETKTVRFLTRIPVDPFTETAEWGLRSYQDDWDSTSWGGENVFDVYSLSEVRALDGSYYRDW